MIPARTLAAPLAILATAWSLLVSGDLLYHPLISLQRVLIGLSLGERAVLNRLDLDLAPGSFTALLGRSSSGKIAQLRTLAGLDPAPEDANVEVPRPASVVFQEPRRLPWKRVWRNVALGLGGSDPRGRAHAASREVGLAAQLRAHAPATLIVTHAVEEVLLLAARAPMRSRALPRPAITCSRNSGSRTTGRSRSTALRRWRRERRPVLSRSIGAACGRPGRRSPGVIRDRLGAIKETIMADTALIDRLPVLDARDIATDPDHFRHDLRRAARDVGFFYLVGHGIDPDIIEAARRQARGFFALPEAEKLAIQMVQSPHFRGYNSAGQELTRGRRDWREQVDIGPEREAVLQRAGVPPWTRLHGPNQWPSALPSLRPALAAYTDATTALAIRLLQAFAEALGQPPDAFAPIHTPPHWLLKIIRYPGRDATEDDQGVGAHKDGGFLTLLLQDDARGLQVEMGDGYWIDADPLPGSFVVNIGELLELASGGYLRATVHRAVTPPAGTDRLSIGYFFGANLDATVPQLVLPPDLAAERRGVTRDPHNPLLRDTGLNALKSRLRSHPDVAERHHADLVAEIAP